VAHRHQGAGGCALLTRPSGLCRKGVKWSRAQLEALPGLCLHDLMLMPLDQA